MKIKLYQINNERDPLRFAFMSLDYILKHNNHIVDKAAYDCVFDGEVEAEDLEDVYSIFNYQYPEDYRGRSMSISDVVEVIEKCEYTGPGFYFCDAFGFKKIKWEEQK